MPDEQQLELIMQDGVHAWNAWRLENPTVPTDISGAEVPNTYLEHVNFENTKLNNVDLSQANLSHANLRHANLFEASLISANLSGADLTGANLTGAKLQHANLTGANLSGANLQNTDLTQAQFLKAILHHANFRHATLKQATFEHASITEDTLGLGPLIPNQRAGMSLVEVTPTSEDTLQESDTQISDNVNNLTVGYARSIVGPAHLASKASLSPTTSAKNTATCSSNCSVLWRNSSRISLRSKKRAGSFPMRRTRCK